MDLLLLVSLILAALLFCLASGRRMEETLAPFLCILMLMLYVLSVFQALPWIRWIAPAAAAMLVLPVARRVRKVGFLRFWRNAAECLLTPGMVCFAVMVAFLFVCSRNHIVHSTDDIHYWAIEVRSLFARDGLVHANQHLSPRFMTYTPGMQLWQWLGMQILGVWNESCLYAMLWLFYAVFLIPLTRKLSWRKAWQLPLWVVCLICIPTLMNVDAYDMLRVDTALGLTMGYALMQAFALWRDEQSGRWELVSFSLALCALVLIKQTGIAWAAMAMIFAYLVCCPCNRAGFWRLTAAFAVPVGVFLSWKLVCSVFCLSGTHLDSASSQIEHFLSGHWQAPMWIAQLPASLWAAVTHVDRWALPMLAWLVILIAMLWLLSRNAPQKCAVRCWCIGASVLFLLGYAVILVLSILDSSNPLPDTAFMSALTNRYGHPLPLGLFMLAAAWALHEAAGEKKSGKMSVVLLAVLTLCFARWNSMYTNFVPEVYAESYGEVSYHSLQLENFWIDELDEEDPAVVLYVSQYPPSIPERLQYPAAPHKVVIAPAEIEDEQAFVQLLENRWITHVICMDDLTSTYETASLFTEDHWLDVSTLYTVSWESGSPLLSY